jgi:large subunit ribosomal protein L6
MPIPVPANVKVDVDGSEVSVTGAKGTLRRTFPAGMSFEIEDGRLHVHRDGETSESRALHGLSRALLNNMVTGVSKGFERRMVVEGVGYRAEMDGKTLVLYVGYSHPVRVEPDSGIGFSVEERGKLLIITGVDKEALGQTAANIRKIRPPEPYKGKGIRYSNEVVRRKAGKTGKV